MVTDGVFFGKGGRYGVQHPQYNGKKQFMIVIVDLHCLAEQRRTSCLTYVLSVDNYS